MPLRHGSPAPILGARRDAAAARVPARRDWLRPVVNDFAQYESAMRQGAEQSGWLIHDAFTTEPHQAAFMFPLYVGVGKLAASLHLPAGSGEGPRGARPRSAGLGLWRFSQVFAASQTAARWTFVLALFASGFSCSPRWRQARSTLATGRTKPTASACCSPHRTCRWPWPPPWSSRATFYARGEVERWRGCSRLAATTRNRPCCILFHLPVLLAAALLVGLVFWRSGRGPATLAGGLAASLGALPILWPTVWTFSLDPFWLATYSAQNQLAQPAPHELTGRPRANTRARLSPGAVLLRDEVGAVRLAALGPAQPGGHVRTSAVPAAAEFRPPANARSAGRECPRGLPVRHSRRAEPTACAWGWSPPRPADPAHHGSERGGIRSRTRPSSFTAPRATRCARARWPGATRGRDSGGLAGGQLSGAPRTPGACLWWASGPPRCEAGLSRSWRRRTSLPTPVVCWWLFRELMQAWVYGPEFEANVRAAAFQSGVVRCPSRASGVI